VSQLALVYKPATTGEQLHHDELAIIADGVACVGIKALADELGVSRQMVSDAQAERDRKRWASEWTCVLIVMLMRRADTTAVEIVRRLIEHRTMGTPFLVIDEADAVTDAELAAAERVVERAKRNRRKS